jgi:hypothetical protein
MKRSWVFCSFLAIVLRKELVQRLEKHGHLFEWNDIKQDLKALLEAITKENGMKLAIRSHLMGACGSIIQSVGVTMPPTVREIS